MQANKATKGIILQDQRNQDLGGHIYHIYLKYHANGDGAKTGVEMAAELVAEPIEISPELAPKRR